MEGLQSEVLVVKMTNAIQVSDYYIQERTENTLVL